MLKGLVKCAHCGMALWAQTLKSGSRLYREQARSRYHIECPAEGKSIRCEMPDEQMARIISAIELGPMWQQQVMAIISVKDEVLRVKQERTQAEQRLRRLGKAHVDGLYSDDDYGREKQGLEEKLAGLVVPEGDATREAGNLLEELLNLWEEADLGQRRMILLAILDAVYVDSKEDRAIVALKPKPAFRALFQIATTREGSGVVLYNENPLDQFPSPEDDSPCSWWRRGREPVSLVRADPLHVQ